MKNLVLKIFTNIFKIFASAFMIFPVRKKITIFTRLNNLTIDVKQLYQELNETFKDYKVIILKDKYETDKIRYIFELPYQIYSIYTSKLVITDSYIPAISLTFKKKSVKIIQMWHAMGAYKKFGYSILDKKEGSNSELAHTMKMHKNYDYVVATSDFTKQKYKEAFNIDDASIKLVLLPRYDYLKENENSLKKRILYDYDLLNNGKKILMYAPTFRKSNRSYFDQIIKNVDYTKYNLIIKKHNGEENIYMNGKLIYENFDKYSIGLLTIADILITDYSSIVFDAMILNKKIVYYTPDYSLYEKERGVYDEIFKNSKNNYDNVYDLFRNLDNVNMDEYDEVKKKHINASINFIDFIKRIVGGKENEKL